MKRHELLRDITQLGLLWAAGFGADLAGAPEPTKYLIAGLWTFVVSIGATAYFGWDRLYARRSFLRVSAFGVVAIGLLVYTGYIIDILALNTWQWISYQGFLVVTWANLFGLFLLFMSVVAYYLSFRVGITIANEWEQVHQEGAEITALNRIRAEVLRAMERLERIEKEGNEANHSS